MITEIVGNTLDKKTIRKYVALLIKRECSSLQEALERNGATVEQTTQINCLLGNEGKPSVALAIDPAGTMLRVDRAHDALRQIADAYPDSIFNLKRISWASDPQHGESGRYDLKLAREQINALLKTSFDHFIARLTPEINDEGLTTVAYAIGRNRSTKRRVAGPLQHRPPVKTRTQLVHQEVMKDVIDDAGLLAISAVFWLGLDQSSWDEENDVPNLKGKDRKALIEATVARALLPIDRLCFGHGAGKLAVRTLVAEIKANAARRDFLRRAPLQPQGVASLMATLPVDKKGSVSILPPFRLP